MKTTFDPQKWEWTGQTTDRLLQHDVVFGTPVNDPMGGLPLGDGDLGSLLWTSEDSLHIHVNKTDLWDDSSFDDDTLCSKEEEDLTSLRHGGEISLCWNSPCLDMLYQDTYEARLSLADAAARIKSKTPFSDIQMEAMASSNAHTTVLYCKSATVEPESLIIKLSRFGSRNMWRWYQQIKHDPTAGLTGTHSFSNKNGLFITQELNGICFCVGLAVITDGSFESEIINSHSASITFHKATEHQFVLYYTIALGTDTMDAYSHCQTLLNSACQIGYARLFEQHIVEWKAYWNRSFVQFPDNYLENIYYLSLYYANCCCRGAYPPHFTSAIWSFRHDFLPWNYYFFYNMQHMYGPLNAAGHGELAMNYYRMRRNGLPAAYRYAKRFKNLDGAFYHDVTDRYGRGADYDSDNCTPAAQIAMAMWQYYRYTGDDDFFQEVAKPVMEGAAKLYLSLLQKGDDGLYHLSGTTAYEGNPPCQDAITDIAAIKVFFAVMKNLSNEAERVRYEDVLNHLPAFHTVSLEDEDWDGDRFAFGMGVGQKPWGDKKVLAYGLDEHGKPLRRSYGNPKCTRGGGGFPDVELAPIYPAGLVGIADKGTPIFDCLHNQLMLHSLSAKYCNHWCMLPLYLARMGMAEELIENLHASVNQWQVFPNGFNADGFAGALHAAQRLNFVEIRSDGTDSFTKTETFRFRYFDFETTSIMAHAVSESLLQSYDNIIRICPAIRPEDDVSFRLYAQGGFVIQAEISEKQYVITVDSLRGEVGYIKLPEYVEHLPCHMYYADDGEAIAINPVWEIVGTERVLNITGLLQAGQRLLLSSCDLELLQHIDFCPPPQNNNMKECGKAILGSPLLPHA